MGLACLASRGITVDNGTRKVASMEVLKRLLVKSNTGAEVLAGTHATSAMVVSDAVDVSR